MRIRKPTPVQTTKKLTRKALRTVEQELGVYLDTPQGQSRCPNQQFGVYDEDENHAGDIVADGDAFTLEELRKKISELFRGDLAT